MQDGFTVGTLHLKYWPETRSFSSIMVLRFASPAETKYRSHPDRFAEMELAMLFASRYPKACSLLIAYITGRVPKSLVHVYRIFPTQKLGNCQVERLRFEVRHVVSTPEKFGQSRAAKLYLTKKSILTYHLCPRPETSEFIH